MSLSQCAEERLAHCTKMLNNLQLFPVLTFVRITSGYSSSQGRVVILQLEDKGSYWSHIHSGTLYFSYVLISIFLCLPAARERVQFPKKIHPLMRLLQDSLSVGGEPQLVVGRGD